MPSFLLNDNENSSKYLIQNFTKKHTSESNPENHGSKELWI